MRGDVPLHIVEHLLVGATSESCADVLILSAIVAGVADGATGKPWDPPGGPTGRQIAETVARVLTETGPEATAESATAAATAEVARLFVAIGLEPGSGSAATFAVVHVPRRQVWRVGDPAVLVDGRRVPNRPTAEQVVANARNMVLRQRLADGARVDDLRRDDPGRIAVEPLLRALVGLRNREVPGLGYGAIDGSRVPTTLVEVIDLPADACELVIATDGYPDPAGTLVESERRLQSRLATDPLMIGGPPATKGWAPDQASFDDRAYVRVTVRGD